MKTRKWHFHGTPMSQAQLNNLDFRTRINPDGTLGIAGKPKTPGDYTTSERHTLLSVNSTVVYLDKKGVQSL